MGVVHNPNLTKLGSIPWPPLRPQNNCGQEQHCPQDFQSQGHISRVKGHRIEIPCHAHLPIMGSPQVQRGHGYLGHTSIHKNPKVKVISPRSKVTGANFRAHVHLNHVGSPCTQPGQGSFNNLDADTFKKICASTDRRTE